MKLKITETSLRDGHQSLIATRLKTEEILPILEKMDNAGYYSLEVWGGATFDACIRFLNEDPWERLRAIRAKVKKTKLQMLIRGQNLLGYKHYADDVVEEFVKKSIENGIDIIRAFDALNDYRNLETTIKAVKKYNGHCQGCIAYTTSDVHTVEYYVKKVLELERMGVDSVCIKDMAGILMPETGYELIKMIKNVTKLPVELHTHCTGGIASILYTRAIEAGVDIIDTAISPFSGGTSQPATEVFAQLLKGTKMYEEREKYNYKYFSKPPYEVFSNDFISFAEIVKLKNLEKVLDFYYNSEKFPESVQWLIDNHYESAFSFYEDIADYFDKKGYLKVSHRESTLFTLLYEFYLEKNFKERDIFVEYLKYDYLMLGKTGFYPEWFKSEKDGELYDEIIREGNYKSIREGHKNSELERFSYNIFTKEFEDIYVFFDYRNKSTRVIKNNREEK